MQLPYLKIEPNMKTFLGLAPPLYEDEPVKVSLPVLKDIDHIPRK